jgi:hypothetical protein
LLHRGRRFLASLAFFRNLDRDPVLLRILRNAQLRLEISYNLLHGGPIGHTGQLGGLVFRKRADQIFGETR